MQLCLSVARMADAFAFIMSAAVKLYESIYSYTRTPHFHVVPRNYTFTNSPSAADLSQRNERLHNHIPSKAYLCATHATHANVVAPASESLKVKIDDSNNKCAECFSLMISRINGKSCEINRNEMRTFSSCPVSWFVCFI